MTKKEYLELKRLMEKFLAMYKDETLPVEEQMEGARKYQELFKQLKEAEKEQPSLAIPEVQKELKIEYLANTKYHLEFTYERSFKKHTMSDFEVSAEGVIQVRNLGGGIYGFSNQGWNLMNGDVEVVDVLTLPEIKVKLRSYGISLKDKKLK